MYHSGQVCDKTGSNMFGYHFNIVVLLLIKNHLICGLTTGLVNYWLLTTNG